ncbi:hypothetical protein clem_09435 [Legionella clemsonensis]|uniref:Uncharacterized protein n=2 Tax=Legionella clemsonensis TaxID=1867846 RepID=A0A222P3N7_9GAMM|nr:hypothetical protein clem_09435 [Legionella clemsonensis]
MKWFWDPYHFKNELGNLILAVILNQSNQSDISSFSTKLDPINLLAELKQNSSALKQWEEHNVEQVIELKQNLLKEIKVAS